MSVNKYKMHILVLPEDDANSQIANGFILESNLNARAIQILPPAGGWAKVENEFRDVHISEMQKNLKRMIVLLIDFDNDLEARLTHVRANIPDTLVDRVFVLGVLSEPENLKQQISMSLEKIGEALSKDCVDNTQTIWRHALLRHNETELGRMVASVKYFLFPPR